MTEINGEYNPDWVSPPGDTIKDILQEHNLSLLEFAKQMGYPLNRIEDLLSGKTFITIELAKDLSRVLGASFTFWMARDYEYWENRLPSGSGIGQMRMEI